MEMRIAICEDHPVQQKNLKAMVEAWGRSRGIVLHISTFGDSDAFLFQWCGKPGLDLLLLDIDLGEGMNGVELARRLRERDGRLQIVFVTGLPEYMAEGYDVQAVHFLIKPVAMDRFVTVLDRVYAAMEKKEEYLLLAGETEAELIPVDRILYAEAFSHSAALYLTSAEPGAREAACLQIRMGMKELEGRLAPSSFFRCHRSYLVHLAHVRKISKNQVFLTYAGPVPVSRSREKQFYQAFLAYHRADS